MIVTYSAGGQEQTVQIPDSVSWPDVCNRARAKIFPNSELPAVDKAFDEIMRQRSQPQAERAPSIETAVEAGARFPRHWRNKQQQEEPLAAPSASSKVAAEAAASGRSSLRSTSPSGASAPRAAEQSMTPASQVPAKATSGGGGSLVDSRVEASPAFRGAMESAGAQCPHASPASAGVTSAALDAKQCGFGDESLDRSGPPSAAGVRDTSMAAYRALQWSGKLAAQEKLVVDHFLANPGQRFTRQELARDLKLGINAICGRVNALLKAPFEILWEPQKKTCSVTGNSVNALELRREA